MQRALALLALVLIITGLHAQTAPPTSPAKPPEKNQSVKPDKPSSYDTATPEEKAKVEADLAAVGAAGGMSLLCVAFVVIASLFFTFIPGMIASARGHESQLAIWLVCFLLGWTGIGWIVALIWSFAATGGNNTTVIVEREAPRRRSRRDEDEEDDRPRRRANRGNDD